MGEPRPSGRLVKRRHGSRSAYLGGMRIDLSPYEGRVCEVKEGVCGGRKPRWTNHLESPLTEGETLLKRHPSQIFHSFGAPEEVWGPLTFDESHLRSRS